MIRKFHRTNFAVMLFILFFVSLAISSCTTNYRIRKEANIDTLKLCMQYSENISDTLKSAFNDQAAKFVHDFNQYEHSFLMQMSDDTTKNAYMVYVSGTKLIEYEQQKFATIITIVGLSTMAYLSLSGAPIILAFWYFPNVVSIVRIKLSPDLSLSENILINSIQSGGYLRSKKAQIKHHKKAFNRFLRNEIEFIEEQYQKR